MDEDNDIVIESDDESLEGEGASASKLLERIRKLKEELVQAKKEKQENLDGWQRAKADYVNAKRRAEEERASLVRNAASDIVTTLLPALDSFDHALETMTDKGAWYEGIKNTHQQFIKALYTEGVEVFDPLGELFDPNRHEPVEIVAVETKNEDNTVTKTYQKGYVLNGAIIRPARVAVGHFKSE